MTNNNRSVAIPDPLVADVELKFSRAIGIVFALMVLMIVGLWHSTPTAPMPSTVPPSLFSSARAMIHVRQIGREPHPLGSEGNATTRAYLIGELNALGLKPSIQSGFAAAGASPNIVGMVNNIIVRIPGRLPGKAVMLAAHYDSVPNGPGAADDGASVAAILETLRAIKSDQPLQNDLICVFTDGEEVDLLGAELFVAHSPLAKEVRVALNFEYRGNSGPFVLFETSANNGKLVSAFASAVPHPIGSSLLYEIYKILPNDTDMTVFKRANMSGLNFAAAEGYTAYHTRLDRPELLNEASLQHEGDTMLALTRHFGNSPLSDLQASDRVFSDVPFVGIVQYPVAWVFPLCAVAILLFALAGWIGVSNGELRLLRIGVGAAAFVVMVAVLAAACQGLWAAILWLHPQYNLMLQGDTYNSHWYLLAFAALLIGAFVVLQSALARWVTPTELGFAAALCWILILLPLCVWMPGVSFVFTWPLLPVLASLAIVLSRRGRVMSSTMKSAILLAGIAPGVVLFSPLVRSLFIELTPAMICVVAALLVLLLGLAAPILAKARHRLVLPALPLVAALTFLVVGAVTSGFDETHPRPNSLFYVRDAMSKQSLWVSDDQKLDAWTQTFFPGGSKRRTAPELFGTSSDLYWTAPAPVVALSEPEVEVLADHTTGSERVLNIRVRSLRAAPQINVSAEGATVLSSSIQDEPTRKEKQNDWVVSAFGLSDEWLRLTLNVVANKPFRLRVTDISYGFPTVGVPLRPKAMMTQPFSKSDTTLVVKLFEVK